MIRILTISLVIFGCVAVWLYDCNKSLKKDLTAAKNEITVLNKQVKGYVNEITRFNEAQAKASEKIEKIRTVVKTVKTDCDCYNTPIPDDVRRLLFRKK